MDGERYVGDAVEPLPDGGAAPASSPRAGGARSGAARSSRRRGAGRNGAGNEREPLAAAVADWIRTQIVAGGLKPGDRIKQEAVAEACGTSRIPVREALNRLKDEGLVTLTSHVGARVARLDRAELNEIYLLRERLEPFVLAQSVPRLDEPTIGRLRDYIEELERVADREHPSRWVELDRIFHLTSHSAARLPQFLELIEGLWNRTQQYRRAYVRLPRSYELAHLEHRLLLNAIEQGDPEDAEAIQTIHIRRTRASLDEHRELFDE